MLATPEWSSARLRLVQSRSIPSSPLLKALHRQSIEALEAELAEIEHQMSELDTTAALLRMAVRWKKQTGKDPTERQAAAKQEESNGDRPALREAITLVLADHGGAMKLADMFAELQRRRWAPTSANPKSQVSARLSKMSQRGQVIRLGNGEYALPPATRTSDLDGPPGRDPVLDR
jgi:hypothetical protein